MTTLDEIEAVTRAAERVRAQLTALLKTRDALVLKAMQEGEWQATIAARAGISRQAIAKIVTRTEKNHATWLT